MWAYPSATFFPVFQILLTVLNKLLGALLMVSVPAGQRGLEVKKGKVGTS
ncbi:unnamed protein product [Spirodela intermedia]|uniref:Uncharacterized protein n=1 Tax=Spirodela intermedia TaxID=51605 RepID=A0A7I8IEP2_SPIIN|nr:unnamed protein product [Spirodela intermedia]CAA6656268.1 unnamed protein product [Spirodela intermedia]